MKKDKVIIHCSATPPSIYVDAAIIDEWHRDKGWSGIGYHYVIKRDGSVEEGRPTDKKGAHAKGYNDCIGICLVGGVSDNDKTTESNFTFKQMWSLNNLLQTLCFKNLIYRDAEVLGHCDLPGVTKDCPCFNVGSLFEK